ncbi:MAG: hypothetical protein RBS77_02370 [Candidatus Moranbacteria bacterium]|jgi:heme O synthase-like polyprenyltransferase|nr:hypothetical protein [Candidatus Moranbacteria bacterium]
MKIIEIAQAQVIANAPTFTEIGGGIVNFMLRVLGFVAIIGLAITAILYFTAGGSEDRIQLAKKSFFYSIVGLIVAVGAMVIFSQIRSFF